MPSSAPARPRPRGRKLTAWAGGPRAALAIVFTDVVQGTRLGRTLGDRAMAALKSEHYRLAVELIGECDGRFIKTIGDAVMAVFKSASSAFAFARKFHCSPPVRHQVGERATAGHKM